MNSARGQHDRELLELRKEMNTRLDENVSEINELSIDRRQLHCMVRN